jgi:hypothetical protein
LSKCPFDQDSIEFLGHCIFSFGTSSLLDKLSSAGFNNLSVSQIITVASMSIALATLPKCIAQNIRTSFTDNICNKPMLTRKEGPNSLIEIIVLAQNVMFDEGGNWGGRIIGSIQRKMVPFNVEILQLTPAIGNMFIK